jgi:hypothetical protein
MRVDILKISTNIGLGRCVDFEESFRVEYLCKAPFLASSCDHVNISLFITSQWSIPYNETHASWYEKTTYYCLLYFSSSYFCTSSDIYIARKFSHIRSGQPHTHTWSTVAFILKKKIKKFESKNNNVKNELK